jgi:branched-chain amino acid transport system substrate-binding protein
VSLTRRGLIGTAAGLPIAGRAFAQGTSAPLRVGLLTVLTGPLASGGIDMEHALKMYLEEHKYELAGRKIELTVADTGGVPATALSKTKELVEKDGVQVIIGPLAAFELLAIDSYIQEKKIATLSIAAAEDVTQRHPNPFLVRASSSSAQCAHPMADYCAKDLKMKRMITIADDIAYGQEMVAGFQRVFEDEGGKIIQKVFPPLTAPDYGTFIASLKHDADGIFLGFAGSNGFRFLRQFNEYGLINTIRPVGGMTAMDEGVLRYMGDWALGIVSANWYTAMLDNPKNAKFAPAFRAAFKYDPGYYAAGAYTQAEVLNAALTETKGDTSDPVAFAKVLHGVHVDTVRGPVKFDPYGNVVGNVYIRKVARKDGRLVNEVIKTYPDVSQFWTWSPKEFLANPVYSRTWPPAKNLEN